MKQREHNGAFMLITELLLTILFLCSPVSGARSAICDHPSRAFEEELLNEINRYRTDHGLARLSLHEGLHLLAERHSRQMCKEGVLNHDDFGGRFRRSGRMRCVENVGWNCATGADQFRRWKNSSDHDRNMLDEGIRLAGISRAGDFVTFFACQ